MRRVYFRSTLALLTVLGVMVFFGWLGLKMMSQVSKRHHSQPELRGRVKDKWGASLEARTAEEKAEEKRGFDLNGFNQYRSDRIALDRATPDNRHPRCFNKHYPVDLPTTSVVIAFRNEALTALLRTVTSVKERSPEYLLHEIILVDDFSDHEDLKGKLEAWVGTDPIIKIVRLTKRKGLVRARMAGADAATGEVLVFLDSHCECSTGWLEPMLERIHLDRSNVVCPVIDRINPETLKFVPRSNDVVNRGGFNWGLVFRWRRIPKYELNRRGGDPSREIKSPTMRGMFAIDRSFFYDIGAYDSGMKIWGAENLEISFRIWMCGGQLEIIPCSHVGHIYRRVNPNHVTGTVTRNNMRLAEVWMDEYKEHFYARKPGIRKKSYGDISDRVELRKKLECKSFKWYLENVYPEQAVPGTNLWHSGLLRNPSNEKCLDTLKHKRSESVGVFTCREHGFNQNFSYTDMHQIMNEDEDVCLEAYKRSDTKSKVYMQICHFQGGNQQWDYSNKTHTVLHVQSGNCLELAEGGKDVHINECNGSPSQEWVWSQHHTPTRELKDWFSLELVEGATS